MYINCIKGASTQVRNVKQINIQEDDSDLEEVCNLLKEGGSGDDTGNDPKPDSTTDAKWNIK